MLRKTLLDGAADFDQLAQRAEKRRLNRLASPIDNLGPIPDLDAGVRAESQHPLRPRAQRISIVIAVEHLDRGDTGGRTQAIETIHGRRRTSR
jgi:hypothetical protein